MSVRTTVLLGLLLVGGWLGLMLALGGEWEQSGSEWPRALEDANDVMAYQKRGAWIASGGRPYLDEFSEYPQLTTWTLGLPWLVLDHDVERGEPFTARAAARDLLEDAGVPRGDVDRLFESLDRSITSTASAGAAEAALAETNAVIARSGLAPEEARPALARARSATLRREQAILATRDAYRAVHQSLQAALFAALIAVLAVHLRRLGHAPAWALLMLLPGSLYFVLHRTDALVALLVALALLAQLGARPRLAGLALGFAIVTKWWPAALVPLFLAQNLARSSPNAPPGTRLREAVLLPLVCLAAVVGAVLSVTFLHGGGGLEAVLELPRWHAHDRRPNHSSLLALATNPEGLDLLPVTARDSLEKLFKVLQFLPGLALALVFPRGRALLPGAAAAVLGVILFSEFYSPQWVIWVTSIALLVAPRHKLVLVPLVAFEVLSYLTFLTFNHAQATADLGPYRLVTWLRLGTMFALLGLLVVLCVREARRERSVVSASPTN